MTKQPGLWRSRWAAIGAAMAVTFGFGGLMSGSLAAPASGPGSTGSFKSITPIRILDTRPPPEQVGTILGPIGPNTTITIQVAGVVGVPVKASAVVMNVTVTGTTATSFLTIWPSDKPRPTASNLNWAPGQTIPNLVTAALSADGKISFYNPVGSTHIIADVAGYYVPGNDKFISLPLTGMLLQNSSVTGNLPGGIRFPDGGFGSYPTVESSFVIPPDYTTGTPLAVSLTWVVNGTCAVSFQEMNLSASRAGIAPIAGPFTSAGLTFGTSVSSAANVVNTLVGTIVSPNAAIPLQAGDSIMFGTFRRGDAPSDTCAGLTAIITGISVTYD